VSKIALERRFKVGMVQKGPSRPGRRWAEDLIWAKYILFGAAGANRPNGGNRIAIDQSLLQLDAASQEASQGGAEDRSD
jgi:hypothetical protein